MNPLVILQEINANYQTQFETRFCTHCGHFRPHLIAFTAVPGTHEQVRREECTECHRGETRLMDEPALNPKEKINESF